MAIALRLSMENNQHQYTPQQQCKGAQRLAAINGKSLQVTLKTRTTFLAIMASFMKAEIADISQSL